MSREMAMLPAKLAVFKTDHGNWRVVFEGGSYYQSPDKKQVVEYIARLMMADGW